MPTAVPLYKLYNSATNKYDWTTDSAIYNTVINTPNNTIDTSTLATFSAWIATTPYLKEVRVTYKGLTYRAVSAVPATVGYPADNPTYWAIDTTPIYSNVSNTPLGGLWYAQTLEAAFLQQQEGQALP